MNQTGNYAIRQTGFSVKPTKDGEEVVDLKVIMRRDVADDQRFALEDMPTLTGASKTRGLLLHVTPKPISFSDDEHEVTITMNGKTGDALALPALTIDVALNGSVKVTDEGDVSLTLRMLRVDMMASGATFDLIADATLRLDCTVNTPEAVDADPLFDDGAALN